MTDAAIVARYLVERASARAGSRAVQGLRSHRFDAPSIEPIASRRIWRLPDLAARALAGWANGTRALVLCRYVPAFDEVLELQASGRRCVTLLPEGADPSPHEDGYFFAIHDLCHAEKFADPEHHAGQVGFCRHAADALRRPDFRALLADLDATFLYDLEHVLADMNGSPVFLFAALKMKLKMAARRKLARSTGRTTNVRGPLDAAELAVFRDLEDAFVSAFSLPPAIGDAARAVSTKRDTPEKALALATFFERRGRDVLREKGRG